MARVIPIKVWPPAPDGLSRTLEAMLNSTIKQNAVLITALREARDLLGLYAEGDSDASHAAVLEIVRIDQVLASASS